MKTMQHYTRLLGIVSLLALTLGAFSPSALAQRQIAPLEQTYKVAPDYRKCAYPLCGGWFLTPVNQYSLQFASEDEALQNTALLPNRIYVADLNFKKLGLSSKEAEELKAALYAEQTLLRGSLSSSAGPIRGVKITRLDTSGAWVSANKTTAIGPYLRVSSSGIVCITTPCPYYTAEFINSQAASNFDELNFEKAELTREQETQAWQAVASKGLIMTGVKYQSQGQTGPGTGIAATKVFFAFPQRN